MRAIAVYMMVEKVLLHGPEGELVLHLTPASGPSTPSDNWKRWCDVSRGLVAGKCIKLDEGEDLPVDAGVQFVVEFHVAP